MKKTRINSLLIKDEIKNNPPSKVERSLKDISGVGNKRYRMQLIAQLSTTVALLWWIKDKGWIIEYAPQLKDFALGYFGGILIAQRISLTLENIRVRRIARNTGTSWVQVIREVKRIERTY